MVDQKMLKTHCGVIDYYDENQNNNSSKSSYHVGIERLSSIVYLQTFSETLPCMQHYIILPMEYPTSIHTENHFGPNLFRSSLVEKVLADIFNIKILA